MAKKSHNIFEKFSNDLFEFAAHSFIKWILYPLLPFVLSVFCAALFLNRNEIEAGGPIYELIVQTTIVANIIMALNWWCYPAILKRNL